VALVCQSFREGSMKVLHRVHACSGVDRARSGGIDLGGYGTGTVVAVTMALVCWTACATSSMAKIETTSSQAESGFSTDILTVDGKERPNLAIEPGRHVVEVVGTSRRVGANASAGTKGAAAGAAAVNPLFAAGVALAGWADATHSAPMKACFIARPGCGPSSRARCGTSKWSMRRRPTM
jgi:hypothetical protein